jgi:hypothetical protein
MYSGFSANFDSESFEASLRLLASGLGPSLKEVFKEIGKKMVSEAKAAAPVRTGNLRNNIRFLVLHNKEFLFTTRKSAKAPNIFYYRMVTADRTIAPKKSKYLTMKINGQWKKISHAITIKGNPFAENVYNDYWKDEGSKGYKELEQGLKNMIEEKLK